METFNGINIDESRLLNHNIVVTIVFVLLFSLCLFLLWHTIIRYQKAKRTKVKKKGKGFVPEFVVLSLLLVGIVAFSVFQVLPSWLDYVNKDYIVYTGDFRVEESGTKYGGTIKLSNGETIKGITLFESDDSTGTIVYSSRSKVVLGYQK